jgi:hypothetical protein
MNDRTQFPIREDVFRRFRQPMTRQIDARAWPSVYGDAIDFPSDPRRLLTVTRTQYDHLRRWAAGDFESDWNGPLLAGALEELSIDEQPRALDQAALDACTGGAFHPGCELTWPMRLMMLYHAPFRPRLRDFSQPERDYGDRLTAPIALAPGGPLSASGPGDLTKWMAIPWQTDTASCRSGYDPSFDPYLPTFWPARVPNHVLTEEDYRRVMDTNSTESQRQAAFESRADWFRFLEGTFTQQINQMVSDFGKQGVVTQREGPMGDDRFPPVMFVESDLGYD